MPRSQRDGGSLQDIPDIGSSSGRFVEVNGVLGAESIVRDDDFDGELGYTLVRMLRGDTVGRRLKRKLFKLGFFQLTCGAALSVICYLSDQNFSMTAYYDNAAYGAKNQILYYCVSYPIVVIGILTWLLVRYWGSIVTNRDLLTNILKFYGVNIGVHLLITIWLTLSLILTFHKLDWGENVMLAQIQPYYISSLIFLAPLILVTMYYAQNIVKMVDEVEQAGTIAEPEVDLSDIMDLSDVTFKQVMLIIVSFPFILLIQLVDFMGVLYRDLIRRCDSGAIKRKNRKPRTRNCFQRFARRMCKCFRKCVTGNPIKAPGRITPYYEEDSEDETEGEKGKRLAIDREVEERQSRQRLYKEIEQVRQMKALEAMQPKLPILQIADIEQGQEQAEEKHSSASLLARSELSIKRLVLSIPLFKSQWAEMDTVGSFETRILTLPNTQVLQTHLEKQGFHVVFAVGPNPNNNNNNNNRGGGGGEEEEEIEIGICNIRTTKDDPWFLARFLITPDSFSAVMKGSNAEFTAACVKKFKVASVLKVANPNSGGS